MEFFDQLNTDSISAERREKLEPLVRYISEKLKAGQQAKLVFICTHNSRRSHFGQVLALAAANQCGISGIETYSGGTEATACNLRTVMALKRAGFDITEPDNDKNPVYNVSDGYTASQCWSKRYDDPSNPSAGFAAVMTCTDADENCPFIPDATRISLPYIDPKMSDDTPHEIATYDERCREIATEMLYVMKKVKTFI